jgi:hypothetical protein
MTPHAPEAICAELADIMRACARDDVAGGDTNGLRAYLRQTAYSRPLDAVRAEQQLRRYVAEPPSPVLTALGEAAPLPDVGVNASDLPAWMTALADALRARQHAGGPPEPAVPETHWEWRARFPELAQFLGGWFSQDMPDEFENAEATVRDYRRDTHPQVVARLRGEIAEFTALGLDEAGYVLAVAELGMEVEPPGPESVESWLARLADDLVMPTTSTA